MESLFNHIYKGKRVFLTGHTGFKGSWLALCLKLLGAEVYGYALEPSTKPNMYSYVAASVSGQSLADIRDYKTLQDKMEAFAPDFIFHLAAQPLVRQSYFDPRTTYETNVMGTLNVLEAARKTDSVKVIINVTSDKCYENQEWIYGYRETDPMGGYDPYSSSKGAAELLTASYRRSYFNPDEYGRTHNKALASVRAGNVIGGGDWSADRLIPDCVKKLAESDDIEIRSPYSIRPWQHVLEPLFGYMLLGAKMLDFPTVYSSGWNFGPGDDGILTVEEVVKKVISCWGTGNYYVNEPENKLHEANLLKLDISKAKSFLGWTPSYAPDRAIAETVSWYRHFYAGSPDIAEFTVTQIKSYVEMFSYTKKVGV